MDSSGGTARRKNKKKPQISITVSYYITIFLLEIIIRPSRKKTYQQESYRSDTSSRSGVSRFRSWGSRNRTARGIHRRPRGGSPRPRTSSPPPPSPRCTGSSPSRDTSATRPTSTRRRRYGISRRVRGCPYRRRSRSAARCRRSGLPPDTGRRRGVPMRTMSWGGCIRSCMIF